MRGSSSTIACMELAHISGQGYQTLVARYLLSSIPSFFTAVSQTISNYKSIKCAYIAISETPVVNVQP